MCPSCSLGATDSYITINGSRWVCGTHTDHPLKGDWADHRECHIGGDFLLIYRLDGAAIIFVRAGTHSELFEE
jgi:addiction module RelE/StbE family toxin